MFKLQVIRIFTKSRPMLRRLIEPRWTRSAVSPVEPALRVVPWTATVLSQVLSWSLDARASTGPDSSSNAISSDTHMAVVAQSPSGETVKSRESSSQLPASSADGGGGNEAPRTRPAPAAVEVHVRGKSSAERLESSSDAVRVVPMPATRALEITDVLARTEGVTVARAGGLGSPSTVRLAGFGGEQVRFFLDGIPLELSGYPFGIGTVPIGLIEQVEIYRGVVPARLGTDALGGAVQLTSERLTNGSGLSTSFEQGAFGTYRWSLVGARRDRERRVYQRIESYADTAENDYPVTVDTPDSSGRLVHSRVHRFHDGYRAMGLAFESGVTGRSYADRLALRTFVAFLDKELQNNPTMTVPYGEASYAKRSIGTNLRYAKRLGEAFAIRGYAGYSARRTDFEDIGECAYDWFGRCVRQLPQPGEIGSVGTHRRTLQSDLFANFEFEATLGRSSKLAWVTTPRWTERRGSNRMEGDSAAEDPATFPQRSASWINALVLQSKTDDEAVQGNLFLKSFLQHARATEALPTGAKRVRFVEHRPVGTGGSVRFGFGSWGFAKAGYEWSVRLPAADEWFGDGVLVTSNTRLRPERSHNAHVTFGVTTESSRFGVTSLESTGFLRRASELIVMLGDGTGFSNQNVARARGIGVEGRVRWNSPEDHLRVSGNVTWQDSTK
ncbi:MAG: TonB-dependent receptor plug domain-containing protein [Polyangiaceae bacterium]